MKLVCFSLLIAFSSTFSFSFTYISFHAYSHFSFFSTVYCVCLKFQFKLNKCEYVRVCVCVECGEIS